jgi:hypothetical protein
MTEFKQQPTKRVLSVAEFCRDYSLSKTKAYEFMNEGKLRSFKMGAKRGITVDAAEEWLALMAQESEAI